MIAGIAALTVLTALHDVAPDAVTPILAAVLAGALGYVNGKKHATKQETKDREEEDE